MVLQQQATEAKEQAIVAVANWRDADKLALSNKSDRDAQRAEYKHRQHLRVTADKLKAVEP